MIPAGTGRLRHGCESHLHSGNADDADLAMTQLKVGRCALHHVAGDGEYLCAQPLAGVVDGRRQVHGAAAGDRAETDGDQRGVAQRDDDVLRIDRPGVGHHLGEDRLHALPLGTGPRADVYRPGRLDPHQCTLEGPDAGALDIAGNAKTEIAAQPSGLALALAEGRQTTDRLQDLVHGAREVTAVIDDPLAVAIRQAHGAGHLVRADHVASPDLGGFEAKRVRDQVHGSLHGEGGLRPAGATIGCVGALLVATIRAVAAKFAIL